MNIGISRRALLRGLVAAALASPSICERALALDRSAGYPQRVQRLLKDSLVIDMLNQFLYRTDKQDLLNEWLSKPRAFTSTDFKQFADSGVNSINFGLGANSLREAIDLFAQWNGFVLQYPQWLARIDRAEDFARCKSSGRYGIIFGLQSSAQFETLDAVDTCYAAGQRISQLCHNFRTAVADGAFEPRDAGISEFGAKVVDRMNAVGMAVDLGHASDRTKLEACELSKVPVILSHGNCRALNPQSMRACTDEAIRAISRRGGVMGIATIAFMVKDSEPVTVDDVIDHVDHVRDLVGIEHVGIGSDAGIESNDLGSPTILKDMLEKGDPRYHIHGTREVVAGLEGPDRMYELTMAMVRRGYSDDNIKFVLGGNWRRVLGEIWRG
ncbi:MAG TPA: membrane dipeptidase [Steroidobacteraceae bacterium]|jgi:membrane dipeptidase